MLLGESGCTFRKEVVFKGLGALEEYNRAREIPSHGSFCCMGNSGLLGRGGQEFTLVCSAEAVRSLLQSARLRRTGVYSSPLG